jgi:predicted nucleic acid-binding protein
VKFWDSSALVPLLIEEPMSRRLRPLAAREAMFVWWGAEVECASALARRERDGSFASDDVAAALGLLSDLANGWHEIEPSQPLREAAVRLVRLHPLRSLDALQLAAAFIAAERRPSALEIVTLDDRLGAAARREGFSVIDPVALR